MSHQAVWMFLSAVFTQAQICVFFLKFKYLFLQNASTMTIENCLLSVKKAHCYFLPRLLITLASPWTPPRVFLCPTWRVYRRWVSMILLWSWIACRTLGHQASLALQISRVAPSPCPTLARWEGNTEHSQIIGFSPDLFTELPAFPSWQK